MSSRVPIGVALAIFILGAVFAPSAVAGTGVTKKASWTYEEELLVKKSLTSESISCPAFNFVLRGTVAGAETELEAPFVNCPEGKLTNQTVEGVNMATGTGKL